jgi:D-tagatose-1,6-bisphosphate aldolase subunit GatZ/KbaZ
MKTHPIQEIVKTHKEGRRAGIYSACCANRFVIEAVMEKARETGTYALIEATANQVNQFGGYTGMNPLDFADFVRGIAKELAFPVESIILGGDHLGPLTWQNEPEESAMEKSEELIRQYVSAGFTKIHIDTSMMLADDDKTAKLSDAVIARRAARLAQASEAAYSKLQSQKADTCAPVYVIGSEVPIPGGAQENDEQISVTTAEQFEQTYETFKQEFCAHSLQDAFDRIVGVVVQPGVEFSDETVTQYDRENAQGLCASLKKHPNIVFEGHSTDYQTKTCLRQMVEDGIAILKVGPALTYVLRQALFALNDIENELLSGTDTSLSDFRNVLENAMLSDPVYWGKYYHGSEREIALKRKYSLSDRCRYYLPVKEVAAAIDVLLGNINDAGIPLSVLEQYMPIQYAHIREGKLTMNAEAILKDRVKDYIDDYMFAVL